EYRFPPGGVLTNAGSGVAVLPDKGTSDGLSFDEAIECQVKPGETGDFWGFPGSALVPEDRRVGGMGKVARKLDAERPVGEWNALEVRYERSRVTVVLNGKEVNSADASTPISGWVCLMNQGTDIRFRNIEVKELAQDRTAMTPAAGGFVPLF